MFNDDRQLRGDIGPSGEGTRHRGRCRMLTDDPSVRARLPSRCAEAAGVTVRSRCPVCGRKRRTTRPKLACRRCHKGANGHMEDEHLRPPADLTPALVAWHAITTASGETVGCDPGGMYTWVIDWRLAFPCNGGKASDSARRRIRARLDSVGRADLVPPGPP